MVRAVTQKSSPPAAITRETIRNRLYTKGDFQGVLNLKSKTFWRFYAITSLILAAAAAVPLRHLLAMLRIYHRIAWPFLEFGSRFEFEPDVAIPFAAVLTAILIGFLILPVLRNVSMLKKRIIASAGAIGIFFGLGLYAEIIAARLNAAIIVVTSRMWHTAEELAAHASIPWEIRIHYYIFSVVLIFAALTFLYNFANTLYGDGTPSKRVVALQGGAVACYTLAYIFVRVMRYADYAELRITAGSVLNAAVCFILAAIAVGLCAGSFIKFKRRGRLIPSILSVITVLALYAAEYFMLGGNFYSYHTNAAVTIMLRIVIIATPGAAVYYLLRKFGEISELP